MREDQNLRSVECHRLQFEDDTGLTCATIVPEWGANVIALSFRGSGWQWPVPILESVDFATVAMKPPSYGIPLLGPTPGRVGKNQNGEMDYRGNTIRVHPSRHGILRHLAWSVTERSEAALTCELDVEPVHTPDMEHPFRFKARCEFELVHQALRCRVRLDNTDDEAQPLALGWHPYLHRGPGCTVVRIPARKMWALDDAAEPTPTGELEDASGLADFRAGRLLRSSEEWDQIFTSLSSEDGVAACVAESETDIWLPRGKSFPAITRRIVRFRTEASNDGPRAIPNVQLYTPPGRQAICFEPLSVPPNAINLKARGDIGDAGDIEAHDSSTFEIVVALDVHPL